MLWSPRMVKGRGRVWRLLDIDVVIDVFVGAGVLFPVSLSLSLSSCSVMLEGSVRNMNV